MPIPFSQRATFLCLLLSLVLCNGSGRACESEAYAQGPMLAVTPRLLTGISEIHIKLVNDVVTVSYAPEYISEDVYLFEIIAEPFTAPRGCERPGQSYETAQFIINGDVKETTHTASAKNWQGEDISALLRDAGLQPNMVNAVALQPPVGKSQKKAWNMLAQRGLVQKEENAARQTEYTPNWIAANRAWITETYGENRKNQTFGIRYPMKMGFSYQLARDFTPEAMPWFMRASGMNPEKAARAIHLPPGGTGFVQWFPVPLSPIPWPFMRGTTRLRFEASREPDAGKYPLYMSVRIGDQQAEGLGQVTLTVDQFHPGMGGMFSSVYFLADVNGNR